MSRHDKELLMQYHQNQRDKYYQQQDNKRYREIALVQAVVVATAVDTYDVTRLAKDFYKFLQGGE